MSIEDRIITGWRLPFLPTSSTKVRPQPGNPVLSRELVDKEERFGLTGEVAWAYAQALPTLFEAPSPSLPTIHPLHCHQGALRAAVVYWKHDEEEEAIKALPPLDFVQTSSARVCRLLSDRVHTFHVDDRDALETLKYHHQHISQVYAHKIEPRPDDGHAPFPITHASTRAPHPHSGGSPPWFQAPRLREDFIPVVKFDLDIWLCWHIYEHRACLVQGFSRVLPYSPRVAGPADVLPSRLVRPWMYPGSGSKLAGRGWAATARFTDQRVERIVEVTTSRRWLLLSSFEHTPYNDALIEAWRERRPLTQIPDTPDFASAHMVSLELRDQTIAYQWLGNFRLLRLRDNTLTQLTEDHDMLYQMHASGEAIDEKMLDALAQLDHVTVKAIPRDEPVQRTGDLRPGDRFILLEKSAQKILAQALAGQLSIEKFFSMGSPHDVAQRALNILDRTRPHNAYIVLVIDSDAEVFEEPNRYERLLERQTPPDPYASQPSPTVRELLDSPAEFDGRPICTRGVVKWVFEQNRFAGAWFEPTVTPDLPMGSWLVEMRGTWHCSGERYGHFGMYKSMIRGEMSLISIERPERTRSENLFQVAPYVPLRATAMIERHLTGWTCQGKWLQRLGGDCRLPQPDVPDRCRAEIVYCVDQFGAVGLFSWKILAEFSLPPTTVESARLMKGAIRGDVIETTGLLVPHETEREYSDWPLLDGQIRVVLPAFSRTSDRHVIPSVTKLEPATRQLGKDGKIVRIIGEIAHTYRDVSHKEVLPDGRVEYRHESIAYNILYATRIFDEHGTLMEL